MDGILSGGFLLEQLCVCAGRRGCGHDGRQWKLWNWFQHWINDLRRSCLGNERFRCYAVRDDTFRGGGDIRDIGDIGDDEAFGHEADRPDSAHPNRTDDT